jgi:HTH-type transcriptional regulator/antitoxin HigA
MEKLTTRKQYDEVKAEVERLIAEATEKGMLEPDIENEYTLKISELSKLMADYEDEYLNIVPLKKKTPLIESIENYFHIHNLMPKDGAQLLEVNESFLVQIMNGKRKISMSLAKRLHSKMGIDANMILEFA